MYVTTVLCIVYHDYLVPSLYLLRRKIGMKSDDLAGAFLIGVARAVPKLIGAFIAGMFVKVGSVSPDSPLSSGSYNVLSVVAICAYFATPEMSVEWWTFTRDCLLYMLVLAMLAVFSIDWVVAINESISLFVWFGVYVIAVLVTGKVMSCVGALSKSATVSEEQELSGIGNGQQQGTEKEPVKDFIMDDPVTLSFPEKSSWAGKIGHALVLPAIIPLYFTMPDVKKPSMKKYFPLTLAFSLVWVCLLSLLTFWATSVICAAFAWPPDYGDVITVSVFATADYFVLVSMAKSNHTLSATSSSFALSVIEVTLALPVAWLLYGHVRSADVMVHAAATGFYCSVVAFCASLVIVFLTAVALRRRVGKKYSGFVIAVYMVYLVISMAFSFQMAVSHMRVYILTTIVNIRTKEI